MRKQFLISLTTVLISSGFWPFATANATNTCETLESTDFSEILDAPTQIMASNLVSSTPGMPAYCQVKGYVSPNVGFELQLPVNWNGKFIQLGCGGNCGSIRVQFCKDPLSRGYACIVSDLGHKSLGSDSKWAYNNIQAEIDWGYRATHVTALAGKAITEHFYRTAVTYSYFMGCSAGGRQGLVEAQRFPHDFDGIIAGAPSINVTGIVMKVLWDVVSIQDENGNSVLDSSTLKLVHNEVLKQCDSDDGLQDGVIENPSHCGFDLSELVCFTNENRKSCLSEVQFNAIKRIYSGPISSDGKLLYKGGAMPGSELDWMNWFVPKDTTSSFSMEKTFAKQLSEDAFRYQLFLPDPGPTWKVSDFNFDRDYKRFGLMETIYSGSNPDLRNFEATGGKLIVYQGWNDSLVTPLNIVDYYKTVEKIMGERTRKFFRLFMLPGVGHCTGGEGAYAIDYLSYLEDWVEHNKAPDVLVSGHPHEPPKYPIDLSGFSEKHSLNPTKFKFTRPVYPYPIQTQYEGFGDPNDASNFIPK